MTKETFDEQMTRLKNRFGEKAFDAEIERLIGIETSVMTDKAFTDAVNGFIGSRKHHDPPLVTDFREVRILFEQRNFKNQVVMVDRHLKHNGDETLNRYLKGLGAESISDAVNKLKGRSHG